MNTNKNIRLRYEVTIYDGQEILTRTMTRQQVMEINPQSFDYFLSTAFGIWGFRTDTGEWVEHRDAVWQGIGDTCIKITQAIQLNPGEFLTPAEIVELTGLSTLRSSNTLSARLKAIRQAHQESYGAQNFFLSRRAGGYGISWSQVKTWCWVERMIPAM